MENISIHNFNDNLIIIKTYFKDAFVNSYLLTSSGKNILIDSGLSISKSKIIDVVKSLGKKIDIILNTHSHWDHIGSNGILKKYFGSLTMINIKGIEYAENFNTQWKMFNDNELCSYKKDEKKYFFKMIGKKFKVDIAFSGEIEIRLGDNYYLQIFSFPGHSDDSICIYDKRKKYLFSGDSILGRGVNNNLNFYSNPYELKRNLINIRNSLDISVLFSAHNDQMIRKKKILNFIDDSINEIDFEQRTIKNNLVKINKKNIKKLTLKVCEDLNRNYNNIALNSVNSFLLNQENPRNNIF